MQRGQPALKNFHVHTMIKQVAIAKFNAYLPSNLALVGIGSSNYPASAQATNTPEEVRCVTYLPCLSLDRS